MKKTNKKLKIIGLIAIILIAILVAIVITINVISNNRRIENESYWGTTANANSNLVANYIKKGITVGGITGTLETIDVSDATAKTEDVLDGETFYSGSNEIKTGAMPNMDAWNATINPGESVTIPEGYHNGSGTVSAENIGNVKTSIVYNANVQRATTFSRTVSGYTEYIVIYASKDSRTSSATLSATNGSISSQNDLTSVDYDDGSASYNGRMWIINSCDKSGTTFSGTIANAAWGTRVIIIGIGT